MKNGTRFLALLLLVTGWYACDRPTPVAPAESTLTITANPTRIGVNGEAVITVLARKSDGRAVNPGTEINFSTDLGTIDQLVITDQRGVAEAILRGDGRIGMATVSATSGIATSDELMIQVGSLASSITLSSNKSRIDKDVPSGGVRIKLTAEVFDDLSNPIKDLSVIFESPVGTFQEGGSVVTNSSGKAKNVLLVKDDVRNFTTFTITASTTPDELATLEDVTATIDIDVSGFAFDIGLTVTPTSIPVTGGVLQLTGLVRDDFGDPAADENVNFITTVGTLTSGGGLIPTNEGGQAFDTLTVTEADLAALGDTSITVTAEVFTFGNEDDPIASDEFVVLLQSDLPIAGFDFEVAGLEVTFTNTSTGDPTPTFEWDFGDGTTSNAAGTTVTYTYAVEGTYTVTLTADNVGGIDAISKDVTVAASPTILVSPASLAFSAIKNPASQDLPLTISNVGAADLTVTGFASTNPTVFSVISAIPPTISPGASVSVTVRFSPPDVSGTANVAQSGTLTILSNDPLTPAQAVGVSGSAIP